MRRPLNAAAIAFAAMLTLAAPGIGRAAGSNPPPTMEVLNGSSDLGPASATITCTDPTTGTAQFTMSGVALGPYPGTFSESGTIGITGGVATSFSASLTIFSGETTIQGTKTGPINFRGTATCDSTGATFGPGTMFFHAGPFDAMYQVTVSGPSGTNNYTGPVQNDFRFINRTGTTVGSMQEVLLTAEQPPPAEPAVVMLMPFTSVDTVGTTHTVTAQVQTAAGAPSPGVTVLFTVTGSVNTTGSCTTDANGQCSFSYEGPQFPGTDAIRGCADSNGNGTADAGEPCGTASKVWILPASTPGQVTGGGYIANPLRSAMVSFGFNAKSSAGAVTGNCNVIDHGTGMHIQCVNVTTLVQAATHATFFGEATVDGVATNFRIDVDDLGEPGDGRDTFKIQTDSGFVAAGTLIGGNIQIHN